VSIFGVTASCHKHFVVISRERQTTLLSVTHLPRSGTAVCLTLRGQTVDNTRGSQIMFENRDFCLPHAPNAPSVYCHNENKTRVVWLPDCERKFEDMFTRFDIIHERDGRTERQTDRRTDGHRATA